ncbi:hypothetical protein AB0F92_41865 [Kitasatospora aureofaciens]|uniref:hypothetical protein n=1 Tax=Kitasatospora aureofaciens TaxID=1894 RepID=UPI0033FDBAF5
MTQTPTGGADLARTALRAARKNAATRQIPAPRPTRPRPADHGREPLPAAAVFLALVAAHGWTLSTAGGGLRDHWPTIVGPDAAATGTSPATTRPPAAFAWSPTPRPGPPNFAFTTAASSPTSSNCGPAPSEPPTSAWTLLLWCSTTGTRTTYLPAVMIDPARSWLTEGQGAERRRCC